MTPLPILVEFIINQDNERDFAKLYQESDDDNVIL